MDFLIAFAACLILSNVVSGKGKIFHQVTRIISVVGSPSSACPRYLDSFQKETCPREDNGASFKC